MPPKPKSDADISAPHFQHPQSQSQSNPAYGQVYSPDPNQADLLEEIQKLTTRVGMLEQKRTIFNTDIIGLVETVTAVPVSIPKNPFQQIKIARISGVSYLYVYDSLNTNIGANSDGWLRVTIA